MSEKATLFDIPVVADLVTDAMVPPGQLWVVPRWPIPPMTEEEMRRFLRGCAVIRLDVEGAGS